MFLCQPCHREANCNALRCLIPTSRGACEKCKEVAPCMDCKDYNFRKDIEPEPALPTFPVDDLTLSAIEHALGGAYDVDPDGTHHLVGAEFTLNQVLDLAAGIDRREDDKHLSPVSEGVFVDDRQHYTPNSVIAALVAEVRRLRGQNKMILGHFTEKGHPGRPCVRTGWLGEEMVERWRGEIGG